MLKKVLVKLITFYQIFCSPFLKRSCRFCPSCSEYAKLALEKHGPYRGILLTFKRVLRCNPFSKGGIDNP